MKFIIINFIEQDCLVEWGTTEVLLTKSVLGCVNEEFKGFPNPNLLQVCQLLVRFIKMSKLFYSGCRRKSGN